MAEVLRGTQLPLAQALGAMKGLSGALAKIEKEQHAERKRAQHDD